MKQLLLYGGYGFSAIMLLLTIYVWFHFRIRKAWGDVRSYRLQKLGKSPHGRKRQYTTRPLGNINNNGAAGAGNETVLLHSTNEEWKVLDNILLLAANEK